MAVRPSSASTVNGWATFSANVTGSVGAAKVAPGDSVKSGVIFWRGIPFGKVTVIVFLPSFVSIFPFWPSMENDKISASVEKAVEKS